MKPAFCQKHLFSIPEKSLYFCGHSLGLMPQKAQRTAVAGISEWASFAVSGWNQARWIDLPEALGRKIAPLIGAEPSEVIVCDSTSVNLYKALGAALALNPKRSTILTDSGNFPADLYIAQAFSEKKKVAVVPEENILKALNSDVAVLMLTHANYRTSRLSDMARLTEEAHHKGVIILWDLSHSVGALPLHCSALGVDFAVGCTYKYLNGGPGAPSFVYAHKKHHAVLQPAFCGWMGHSKPFSFDTQYIPAEGVLPFLSGTPSILSMKALEGALELYEGIDQDLLRKAAQVLTDHLIALCEKRCPEFLCLSPKDAKDRGSHVAFGHPEAYSISRALIQMGCTVDYRQPDLIRLGVNPLYNDLSDIEDFVNRLEYLFRSQTYREESFKQLFQVT